MKMNNEIDTLVNQEIEAFEQASLLAGFTEPGILVFVTDQEGKAQQPIRVMLHEPIEYQLPDKLDIITDMLQTVETDLTKEGYTVYCSIFSEHMIGENDELVYIQEKNQHKIKHKIFRISRENFYVDPSGRLKMEIKTERFENS